TQLLKNDSQSYKSAVFATGGGCLPVPKVSDKNHPHYLKFVETVLHYALKKDIDTIVLGAQWLSYFGGESSYFVEINSMELPLKNQNGIDAAYIELEKMIQNLINQQKKVCIILPMPLGKDFDPQSIFKRTLLGEWEFCIKNVDANLWRQRSKSVCEKLKKIATHNGAEIIDPTIYFCNESICKVSINGNPIYKDGGHLRPSYVRANITFLDKIMKK
ncbi:MAG: SGNH hydrolase domain-containing protein, partial [Proteobacteria bacterium]|nr:SGNH hydrolase domain-containing protein [Pseudomonadota bacterium]